MACCYRPKSGCWRRSTIAISSSIPIPIRPPALPSAIACSSCRAQAGRITRRRFRKAAAFSRAASRPFRSARKCRPFSALPAAAPRQPKSSPPFSRPMWTCSGSAVSAPMCAPAAKPMPLPVTAPMTPCASPPASFAPRWSAKAPIWARPSSPASNMPWPVAGSIRTPSTIRPASIPPTLKSTSRSRCSRCWPTALSPWNSATASSPR